MFIQCLVYRSYLFLWAMFVVLSSEGAEFNNFQGQEFDISEQVRFEGECPWSRLLLYDFILLV
jgi:hypothetical protein